MRTLTLLLTICTCYALSNALLAQAIDPAAIDIDLPRCTGEVSSPNGLCLELAPLPALLDVVLAVNLTNAGPSQLATLQAQIGFLLPALHTAASSAGSNMQVGLVSSGDYDGFFDACGGARTYGVAGSYPFAVDAAVGSNDGQIAAAVAALSVDPAVVSPTQPGDFPDAYGRVLWEMAQLDSGIGLRPGSARVLVLLGSERPHDCNLQEGVPSAVFGAVAGEDPGRDAVIGTSDDLDWQDVVLPAFLGSGARLAFVHFGSPFFLSPWQHWAGLTGGVAEQATGDLVTQIPDMLAQIYSEVNEVSLAGDCGSATGVTFDVSSFLGPIDVSAGATLCLTETITVPAQIADDPTATVIDCVVDVLVDGAVHGQQSVHIDLIGAITLDCDVPVADAGEDQCVSEGAAVTLDGSGSYDPNSDPLTYSWTQVAGAAVTLDVSDPIHPTFTAPLVGVGGETLTFVLVVNDGTQDGAPDSVDVAVKNLNHPPVAEAGPDQTVSEESTVILDGSDSYDPDAEAITYSWVQISGSGVTLSGADTPQPTFTAPQVGPSGETLTFELTVSDCFDQSPPDTVDVTVENVNHNPTADAGEPQTRDEDTLVSLDGTGSSDPDGDALAYSWVQTAGPTVALDDPTSPTPSFTAPSLVAVSSVAITFELTVSDGLGGVAADSVVITIVDTNAPPSCGLAQPSVAVLWPPNHKLRPVSITGVSDPDNASVTIQILSVTQDEPLNGVGDGDTAMDAVIMGDSVLLRAERAGGGNGRVYVINFQADDGVGGVCAGSVSVCVPHDKKALPCVDDGQAYNSLEP